MIFSLGAARAQAKAQPAKEAEPALKVSGKIFARAGADERVDYARELSIPLARLQAEATFGLAEAVMEADIASKSLVKDAYIRLNDPTRTARLYVGQFKSPFLARALESRWKLPLISRGLVDDYLTERNQLGGRRKGAMGEVKLDALRELTLLFGVFEGGKDELGQRMGEDASARVEVEPLSFVDVGLSGYAADAAGARDRLAASADVRLTLGGARLTLEGTTGRLAVGRFNGQLALASYVFQLDEVWAVEPLVSGEALQLRGPVAGQGYSAVGGVNVHYEEQVRLQVQAERGLFPGDLAMKTRVMAQLGAQF